MLTNAILAGKVEESRQSTYAAVGKGSSTNEVLDALVEAANIIIDLFEVGEYTQDRLVAAENAVASSLQVIEDRLAESEKRFGLKVAVGPVELRTGSLLSLVLSAALRSVGLRAVRLGKTQTPLELLRNSEELEAELVVPLLNAEGIEEQLRNFESEAERGGFKKKFDMIVVAPGFKKAELLTFQVVSNTGEAISKAVEWAMRRRRPDGSG